MSASPIAAIVERLEERGVRFRFEGHKVKARLPEPTPPEILETLETLRARRSEVATLLRERQGFTVWAHCDGAGMCACPACSLRRTSEPVPCCMPRVNEHQAWVFETWPQTCWHCGGAGKCRCL